MSSGPLRDLEVPPAAARLGILVFTVFSGGLLMLAGIAATDGHTLVFAVASLVLAAGLYVAGGAGYRLRQTKSGRVEVHTLFRVKHLDLTRGFEVKEGRFGARVVRIATPNQRARLNGSIGGSVLVREWLEVAASQ